MNLATIELATQLLSDECVTGEETNGNKTMGVFPHMANELLDYFYDCNPDGAVEYQTLKERCQLLACALEDVIGVYQASHPESS